MDILCAVHHVVEASEPGDYMMCNECWHVWRTEAAFQADLALAPVRVGLSLSSCPLCAAREAAAASALFAGLL